MTREEALKQIEEISTAFEASNRLLLSGMIAIFYGLTILFVPVIEIYTQQLTFGRDLGEWRPLLLPFFHVVVYLILFNGVRLFVERRWVDDRSSAPHPALAQTLAFHRPVGVAVCGSILMLGYLGQEQLIYPVCVMLFGIIINIYGRFSSPFLYWTGWSYILLGAVFGALTKGGNPNVWIGLNTYLGLSLMVGGMLLRKERKSH